MFLIFLCNSLLSSDCWNGFSSSSSSATDTMDSLLSSSGSPCSFVGYISMSKHINGENTI